MTTIWEISPPIQTHSFRLCLVPRIRPPRKMARVCFLGFRNTIQQGGFLSVFLAKNLLVHFLWLSFWFSFFAFLVSGFPCFSSIFWAPPPPPSPPPPPRGWPSSWTARPSWRRCWASSCSPPPPRRQRAIGAVELGEKGKVRLRVCKPEL